MMTDRDAPILEMRGIKKSFGPTVAVDSVDLTVHAGEARALVGRNGAGKSTLVAIMTGLLAPDAGTIAFEGQPAPALGDRNSWRRHVACVYQKSTIVPDLSVAENLLINRQGSDRTGLISWRSVYREAEEILELWQVDVDPRVAASALSVEERQLVEIARSLSLGARFVVLDEPTAQLDKTGIDRLFGHIEALQEAGVTFIYISHHLQEVYDICRTVTVLRDAREVITADVDQLSRRDLIHALTGDRPSASREAPAPKNLTAAEVVLEAKELSGQGFNRIDLTVRRGEVLGLAGIIGSGKVALAEALSGLRPATSGRVLLRGEPVRLRTPAKAIEHGIGCVPQDRHHEGLVPGLGIAENATMTRSRGLSSSLGLLDRRAVRRLGAEAIRDLDIRAAGPDQSVWALSGGNQQKVVMARALGTDPDVLVLINPTAGVDVKSKEALMAVAERASEDGRAVIIVSDELDDLRICDRVLVLFEGRIAADVAAGWSDADLVATTEGVGIV